MSSSNLTLSWEELADATPPEPAPLPRPTPVPAPVRAEVPVRAPTRGQLAQRAAAAAQYKEAMRHCAIHIAKHGDLPQRGGGRRARAAPMTAAAQVVMTSAAQVSQRARSTRALADAHDPMREEQRRDHGREREERRRPRDE